MADFEIWSGLAKKYSLKQIGIYTLRGQVCPAAEKVGFKDADEVKAWYEANVEYKDYYIIYVLEKKLGKEVLTPIFGDEKV